MNIKNIKGFTLVEVIIAAAILLISATLLTNLVFTGYRNRDLNRERLEMTRLSSSILDEVKSGQAGWVNAAGLPVWLTTLNQPFIQSPSDSNTFTRAITDSYGINYNATLTIDNTIAGVAGLIQIQVTITSPNAGQTSVITRFRG